MHSSQMYIFRALIAKCNGLMDLTKMNFQKLRKHNEIKKILLVSKVLLESDLLRYIYECKKHDTDIQLYLKHTRIPITRSTNNL